MAIDTSGKWWVGSEPADLRAYLTAYWKGLPVDEFRLAKCSCGADGFHLDADDDEGVARRTCATCGHSHFIGDSDEVWADAAPERWVCVPECGKDVCNIGVGFSLYAPEGEETHRDVRFLGVGTRCTTCGTLGSFAGWKVAHGPSHQLLDKV